MLAVQIKYIYVTNEATLFIYTLRKKGTKAVTGAVPFQKVNFYFNMYILGANKYILGVNM